MHLRIGRGIRGEVITFVAYGTPAPKGSMKAFMPNGARFPVVTHDNSKTKPWSEAVKWAAINAVNSKEIPYKVGPVAIHIAFYFAKPKSKKKALFHVTRPDADKLLRCALDALKGIIWSDDSQVNLISATKDYTDEMPRAEIRVDQLREELWQNAK
jgi:Holliday junction resolvase RusA-like endonuclease